MPPWHGHMHGASLGSSSSSSGQTGMLHMLAAAAASLFGTQVLHGGLPDHTSNMMAGADAVDHVGYARHLLAGSTSTHQQISTTQVWEVWEGSVVRAVHGAQRAVMEAGGSRMHVGMLDSRIGLCGHA